ncbi:alpha/beta fold hydrolase, partial [Patescibacteria group bacterium]|nr:alpha/beta fold hydrolase [Patescibacteria group bacterium]
MLKKFLWPVVGVTVLIMVLVGVFNSTNDFKSDISPKSEEALTSATPLPVLHSMSIESLRQKSYPGSDIFIEETLATGSNYDGYIASYQSEGNKIYGLLTVPKNNKPEAGYPIIVFLHGYISPSVYKTTERYVAYQDGLARNGFITYKIDLRGHGNSEGRSAGSHFSEAYVIDTLNAISSLKKYSEADAKNIGVWGHSNGGEIGLRAMAVSKEIKAGVFWAGVVGSFEDMLETYNEDISFLSLKRSTPQPVKEHGLPSENPEFWQQIDPHAYLDDIGGAIQLH